MMNTRILTLTVTSLLIGLAWPGQVLAQQPKPSMPSPQLDRGSCEEIKWHEAMIRDYPWMVRGCQETIIVDGQHWARFEAEFQQFNADGSITSNFKSNRGRSLGNVRLMPAVDQRVLLDGRPYRFSELRRGQTLNFYAPDDMYAFTTKPGAPASEMARAIEPVMEEPVATQIAQAPTPRANRPDRLPATAGALPLLALGGLLSLLGGITLTVRRRLSRTAN